jgi:hypothetical protein
MRAAGVDSLINYSNHAGLRDGNDSFVGGAKPKACQKSVHL